MSESADQGSSAAATEAVKMSPPVDQVDPKERADALRRRFADVDIAADDLAETVSHAALIARMLDDIWEVARQLFAGGVAYPDPDMPTELDRLMERAERYGLATAVELLGAMQAGLRSLAKQTDLFSRADRSEQLWNATQRLVTWLRLFRQEHDLVTVQGRLTQQAMKAGEAPAAASKVPRVPVRSLTCWPAGVVRRGKKLTILAVEIERHDTVRLVDELPDVPALGPFSGLIISRLFRDQLRLAHTLSGLVRLEEHPVVKARVAGEVQWQFRPAFTATARAIAVARNFVPPPLPVFVRGELPKRGDLGVSELVVSQEGPEGVELRWPDGERLSAPMSDALTFNLVKLCAREGSASVRIDATLHRPMMGNGAGNGPSPLTPASNEGFVLVAAATDLDGHVFPSDDVRAFCWDRSLVAQWAADDCDTEADVPAVAAERWSRLLIRAAAYLHGGASSELMGPLADAMAAFQTQDWERLQRFNSLLRAYGEPPMALKGAIRRALSVIRAAHTVKRSTSKGYVTSETLFGALAAVFDYGAGPEEDLAAIEALLQGRFAAMVEWGWTEVCCRALLLALAGETHGEDDVAADAGEGAAEPRGVGAALAFVDAHIEVLRRPRRQDQAPLDSEELLKIAYTLRTLTDGQIHEPALEVLDLPWRLMALPVANSLYQWRVSPAEADAETRRRHRVDAGTALLLGLESGLSDIWMMG